MGWLDMIALQHAETHPGYAHADPMPKTWSAVQRIVWLKSTLEPAERAAVVEAQTVHPTVRAFALVSAGRWVVPCPMPGCNSATYASREDHRFWCVDCSMRVINGQWVEVTWPEEPEAVESWLSGRPLKVRNWNPGETAEDIAEQDKRALTA